MVEGVGIQCRADRQDLPVHHGTGRNDVRSGGGIGGCDFGEDCIGRIVVHIAFFRQRAAVAVVGIGADADIGGNDQFRKLILHFADGALNRSLVVIGGCSGVIFFGIFHEAKQ